MESWGTHLRASFALGIPLVGSQLGLMLMNTTDTVMLGWYGVEELAASVLATQVYFVVMIFGAGICQAVMPMAAQAEGEGDQRMVRRVVRMGFWISIAYAFLTMPLFFLGEKILLLLGQEPRISALAGEYLFIAAWAMYPTLMSFALRSFLTAIQRAQIILWSTLGAALANVVINYMLIFGNWGAPELGIRGAAIATLLVNVLMFIAMALYVVGREETRRYDIFARFWRADWAAFFSVLKVGLPIGITILAEVGMFIFASIMVGWLGVIPLAAHGIALQLASLAFMVPLGMSQVATVRVSNAYGKSDPANLWRAANAVMIIAIAFAVSSALLFLLMPQTLIGLFLDESKESVLDVLAYAVPLLFVAAVFQLVDSTQAVAVAQLRGLKDTKVPMAIAVFAYWCVGLGTAYILGIWYGLGGVGVWTGLAFGLAVAAVLLSSRFLLIRPR
ncbi:MAG: MATE family efflux transporter [Ahrensia sp.]|nr:MATE family efflux transporter [Ahrensia sp.]